MIPVFGIFFYVFESPSLPYVTYLFYCVFVIGFEPCWWWL